MKGPTPIHQADSPGGRKGRKGVSQRSTAARPESSWTRWLGDVFSIDPRSLALFRVLMGTLLLADLFIRSGDLTAMYTDGGMFSRAEICYRVTSPWNWSFHFGSGAFGYQSMLFALAALFAFALLIGFETRLATIASWLMLVSLHHRVPPILSGADILFRMLLFWAMFLPLERIWSIDAWRKQRRGQAAPETSTWPILSVASAAILLQMAQMYFFSAIFKSNSGWIRGEIIAGGLAHNFFAKPLGAHLLQFPQLLTASTWAVFILEWVGPLMLFSPKRTLWLRSGTIAALAAMHLGIALLLEVDLFSWVSIMGLSLFLPAEFWNSPWMRWTHSLATKAPGTETVRWDVLKPGRWSYLKDGVCLFLLLYVIVTNIKTLPGQTEWVKASFLRTSCGLAQKWNMFDEVPSKNGWYVAWAKLTDGSEVNLLQRDGTLSWTKPNYPAALYPSHRWRKVFREMAYEDILGYHVFRLPIAQYLCRNWNAHHGLSQQVAEFDLVFCTEQKVDAPGKSNVEITQRERLVHLRTRSLDGALTDVPSP